ASVHIETVAHGDERAAARTLLPIARRAELPELLGELLPALPLPSEPLEKPPARSRRRYTTAPVVFGMLAGTAATIADGALWPLIPALALAGAGVGALRFRDAGWALFGTSVAIRSRGFSRSTLVARAARLQQTE